MAQYDVGMKHPTEAGQCFECGVVVESFLFLYEVCNYQREAEDRFDLNYATWKQQQSGETFGQWLVRQARENGAGDGDGEKGKGWREKG